jgi:hypothetical protein
MSKYIELAKKLKALAEKGVGGEKVNAEKMLNDLLKKHNLKIEDIEGEQTIDYFFTLKKEEERLWGQVVARVNHEIKKYGPFSAKKVKDLGLQGNYMITCTVAEYVEIDSMLNIYQKLYKQELKIFFVAFCKANDLLVSHGAKSTNELSKEDQELWLRANAMASKIKSESYRKQITN